jgi:hypothetical protein
MSDQDIINEVREKIVITGNNTRISYCLDKIFRIENAPYKQNIDKIFVNLARLINNLYMHIEESTIMNFGLKTQIDSLKDILLQISLVKNNPYVQHDIDKIFGA